MLHVGFATYFYGFPGKDLPLKRARFSAERTGRRIANLSKRAKVLN